MKEEQERGRVTAIKNRRKKAVENALKMVPAIKQAYAELSRPTLRELADWLNLRDYKTVKGKTWRAQTVSNLLSVDDLIIRNAEAEHDRERAIEMELCLRRIGFGQDREITIAIRDRCIAESYERLLLSKAEALAIRKMFRPPS